MGLLIVRRVHVGRRGQTGCRGQTQDCLQKTYFEVIFVTHVREFNRLSLSVQFFVISQFKTKTKNTKEGYFESYTGWCVFYFKAPFFTKLLTLYPDCITFYASDVEKICA